jgi:DNA-binding SARP family transcriptional activator/predicted ATPase
MTQDLRIRLFGAFEIELNGKPLTGQDWPSQQTQTIFKILLTHPGEIVTSDQLIEILWPNDPVNTARRRLHVRVSQLRKLLEDKKSLLKTVHNGYLFEMDESCWLDADLFQSRLRDGSLLQENNQGQSAIQAYEEARVLYRGDFLAEDIYEDWTFTIREFYRESFLTLLIELSESYAQQGRYRLALARARQALSRDPLRETIYTRLMLYHYYAGDRAQALRTYENCRELLKKELGVSPLESTNRLFEQIKMGTLWKSAESPHYPPPIYDGKLFEVPYALSEIPFAGREREYAWLVSQWKDPGKKVILLEGEAGVGKSRLLEAFTGYIKSQGAQVLDIRLSITESTPVKAVITALGSLLTESVLSKLSTPEVSALAALYPEIHERYQALPTLPPLTPEAERLRLQQAVSALAALPEVSSALIIVDDAHRLGADGVELLKLLSQSLKVLVSFRVEDTPADHPIRRGFGENGIRLQPLSPETIQTILHQLSGDDQPAIAAQISRQSGGNPLFVVALLQHMFETGGLFVDSSGAWQVTNHFSTSLPETLRQTIEMRLGHLNRAQRTVLDYAAVMGGEFSFKLLMTAIQQPEENLLKHLDELMDAALVIEPRSLAKPEFMISHDRYTEVAYETMPPVRRRSIHLAIAQAIEQVYQGQLEQHLASLADHFDRAEQVTQAAHYAALAGEQAAEKFAVSEALHYLGRALALLPDDQIAKEASLRLKREKVYSLQGMRQAQNQELNALEALSPQLPTKTQAEICLRRAAYEWIMGNYPAEKAAVTCAIQKSRACHAKELEARAYFLLGQSDDDMDQRVQHLKHALDLARETKSAALEGDILRWMGNTAFWQNQYAESVDYLAGALAVHRDVGDLRGELSALNNLGHLYKILGNPQEAASYYEQAHQICQKIHDKLAEGVILTNLGGLALDLGHFEDAQSALTQAAEIRAEIGNEEGLAMAENQMGQLFRQLGRYDQSLAHYQKALAINIRFDHEKQTCETLNGLAALYREMGDFARAQAYLDQSFARNSDKKAPRHIQACIEGCLLYLLKGDPRRALRLGEEALALSEELPAFAAAAHKNIGHVLLALDRTDDARAHFEASQSGYHHLAQRHLATEPLAGLGATVLGRQNLDEGISSVEAILEILNGKPLYGPDRLLWVYLTAYHVLAQFEDPRAEEIIRAAHSQLQARAASIPEADLRETYLGEIQENQDIAQLWKK